MPLVPRMSKRMIVDITLRGLKSTMPIYSYTLTRKPVSTSMYMRFSRVQLTFLRESQTRPSQYFDKAQRTGIQDFPRPF